MIPKHCPLRLLLPVSCLSLLAPSAEADNGALTMAYPLPRIEVDGQLNDWPAEIQQVPIELEYNGGAKPEPTDFEAFFRVGYRMEDRSLYVALQVRDDSHVVHEARGWDAQDSHILYIDPTHSPRGSGPWLFSAMGEQMSLMGLENGWDPQVAEAPREGVQVAVKRVGDRTTYEWRVPLGEALVPGRSLGLDHLVTDRDADDEGNTSTMMLWGPIGGKSRGASRLGDVVLAESPETLGTLRGRVRWQAKGPEAIPEGVRLTSLDRDDLFVHLRADDQGFYEVRLPAGHYAVSSPFKNFGDDHGVIYVIDRSVSVKPRSCAAKRAKPRLFLYESYPSRTSSQ